MPPYQSYSRTTQLLTCSSLNLRYHAKGQPEAANAAARDAALAAKSAPHLPATWLALFSACHAASDFQKARDALMEGLQNCPHDQALQLLAAASQPPSSICAICATRQNPSCSSTRSRIVIRDEESEIHWEDDNLDLQQNETNMKRKLCDNLSFLKKSATRSNASTDFDRSSDLERSSRFRLLRQVARNANVEKLGRVRPDAEAKPTSKTLAHV